MNKFSVNQIVRGQVCGVFVILGFHDVAGTPCARLKEVNPNNLTQTAPGELSLPIENIREYE